MSTERGRLPGLAAPKLNARVHELTEHLEFYPGTFSQALRGHKHVLAILEKGVVMATHEVTERSVGERMELTGTRLTGRRSETKWAPLTTEFWAMVALVVAILISAAVINGGDNGTDEFIARQAWLYVSILGAGYFISRGLAKSGSREPYYADGSNGEHPDRANGEINR